MRSGIFVVMCDLGDGRHPVNWDTSSLQEDGGQTCCLSLPYLSLGQGKRGGGGGGGGLAGKTGCELICIWSSHMV